MPAAPLWWWEARSDCPVTGAVGLAAPLGSLCSFLALASHSGAALPLSHVLELKCLCASCALSAKAAGLPNC